MPRRIEIELTSRRDDGTWTWRAAGAREPKGVVDSALVPSDTKVNDVVRADVESDLDGTRVLSIVPPKTKTARTGLIELLPSNEKFEPVTQKLAKRSPSGGKNRRDSRGPGKRTGDGPDKSGPRKDRPRRPSFEAPPELPQRPRPKRLKPGREHLDAVLAQLPEAHRVIAEKVIGGGLGAVRQAIKEQNETAAAEGREKIPMEGLVAIAEKLMPTLRHAQWKDRALAARDILQDIDLRDLRSILASSDSFATEDEEMSTLIADMKKVLVVRQETDTKNWLEDVEAATKVGRIVRALKLSSQPPKAGVPFPAPLATELVAATHAALAPDAPPERWVAVLEAAAFSPVRTQILPPVAPEKPSEELLKTVARLGPLMPQVAALFSVPVDPKARPPRPLLPNRDRSDKKPVRNRPKTAVAPEPADKA